MSALYVFERSVAGGAPVWTETAKLTVSDPGPDDFRVRAVALAGDRIAAGTFGTGEGSAGAAYVFRRDPATGQWSEEARLVQPPGAADFARSVALSGTDDGALLLVGAPLENEAGVLDAGAVYAYRYDADGGAGSWVQEARLVAATPTEGDGFGAALDVVGDAETGAAAVVGAVSSSFFGDGSGAAHVLRRAPGQEGVWREEAKLVGSGVEARDSFGRAVAYAGSVAGAAGDAAVVGAPLYSGDALQAGAAYVFRRGVTEAATAAWSEAAWLVPPEPEGSEEFGTSVAAEQGAAGLEVVVGVPNDSEAGLAAGAAYWHGPGQFVAAEPEVGAAAGLAVSVYPTPARGPVTIEYVLAEAGRVSVAVYDVLGREVARLADGWQAVGAHRVQFEARSLPAGVYVIRVEIALSAGRAVQAITQKLTLLR